MVPAGGGGVSNRTYMNMRGAGVSGLSRKVGPWSLKAAGGGRGLQ